VGVEVSMGQATDDRFKDKKRAILESLNYKSFIVIDYNAWKHHKALKTLDNFFFKIFKEVLLKTKQNDINAPKNTLCLPNGNMGARKGVSFSSIVKGIDNPMPAAPFLPMFQQSVSVDPEYANFLDFRQKFQKLWGYEPCFCTDNVNSVAALEPVDDCTEEVVQRSGGYFGQ